MGKLANLTSPDNYFEDFEVGQVIRHARGKTMTPLENVNITNITHHIVRHGNSTIVVMCLPHAMVIVATLWMWTLY